MLALLLYYLVVPMLLGGVLIAIVKRFGRKELPAAVRALYEEHPMEPRTFRTVRLQEGRATLIGDFETLDQAVDASGGRGWRTILINCDCHTFDEVERQLIKAIRCTLSQARSLSWEVHTKGQAVVYEGPRERCEAVADVLGSIGLRVKLSQ